MVHPGKLRTTLKRLASRSLPWSGAPERWFTQVRSGLPWKHSSLLQKFANYGLKSLITLTFLREARSLRYSGTPERCLTQVGSSLTRNY
jgi:hypothetical protein